MRFDFFSNHHKLAFKYSINIVSHAQRAYIYLSKTKLFLYIVGDIGNILTYYLFYHYILYISKLQ